MAKALRMKTTEETIMTAMDCSDKEILPFLPYILQDFWEIGSDPEVIISLIKKHAHTKRFSRALDLGCGKGAVSVNVAKKLKIECHGIDALPEFIAFARSKAIEYGVENLCRFEVGDIREAIKSQGKYDIIILGAIGQVFGDYHETLSLLGNHLDEEGIIIIDDGYIEDPGSFAHNQVFSKDELLKQISDARMQILDEIVVEETGIVAESHDTEYENIAGRCRELIDQHPDKAAIFSKYSNQQKEEYAHMKSWITCATMVVKPMQAERK